MSVQVPDSTVSDKTSDVRGRQATGNDWKKEASCPRERLQSYWNK
jgi:hypothetical protein